MSTKTLISGEELIGEILSRYPDAAQIMEDFGLHCTSCSVNAFEPLRLGALSHGMEEENVDKLIQEINHLAAARHTAPADGIYLTARAAAKVQEFANGENKPDHALRITAKNNGGAEPAYAMDFVEKENEDDKVFEFHGVQVVLDPESLENLKGADVDFLETELGSGFKITNPNFKSCCSGGTCSGGGCGTSCGCKE